MHYLKYAQITEFYLNFTDIKLYKKRHYYIITWCLGGFMKFTELLKKYWFVLILAILAIVFIVIYAIDMQANAAKAITAKQENDQYVIYSIDGENYYADDLYDELYARYGFNSAFSALDRMVIDEAIETTSEMKQVASANAQYLLSSYDKDTLENDLRSMGFDGIDELDDYYIYLQKSLEFSKQFFTAHQAEYVDPYMEKNPKTISHILIKVADIEKTENEDGTQTLKANPTEEETTKLNEVLEQLKTKDFAEVALEYSEDSSATSGGYLGLVDDDSSSQYVQEFADAAMKLSEGEVSDVVLSEYGYHIIKCDASTVESLLSSQDFISALYNTSSNLYAKAIVEKIDELKIEITNEEFKNQLDTYLNESEGETE